MKAYPIELSSDLKSIELMPVADLHIGDPLSSRAKILSDIEYIRSHEDCYCVLNGDLMNCAIKTAVSDVYSETLSPMQELQVCIELFGPISDKVIFVTGGNHEERHYRTNGIDLTRLMCQQLGIEDRYSPGPGLVYLRFGADDGRHKRHRKICYILYVTHGNSNGRKDGGKIQRLADYATIVDADIYIAGHSHLGASFKKGFLRPCPSSNAILHETHLFVNTSAALEYGGYGERFGFDPPCLDRPIIYLSGTHKEMRATI